MLALDGVERTIQTVVANCLNVASRVAVRLVTRVEVEIDGQRTAVLCQTENMSSSGLLLSGGRQYETGTRVSFQFLLPGHERPCGGIAEVVRHTTRGREGLDGIGVRFVSFTGDSRERFDSYLTSQKIKNSR